MFIDMREESMIRQGTLSGRETVNLESSPIMRNGGFSLSYKEAAIRSLNNLSHKPNRLLIQQRAESKDVLSKLRLIRESRRHQGNKRDNPRSWVQFTVQEGFEET